MGTYRKLERSRITLTHCEREEEGPGGFSRGLACHTIGYTVDQEHGDGGEEIRRAEGIHQM